MNVLHTYVGVHPEIHWSTENPKFGMAEFTEGMG